MKDEENQAPPSTDQFANWGGTHDILTSTSSPSPISFFSSEGGGNLTSLKGTWRSGCHLEAKESQQIPRTSLRLFKSAAWHQRKYSLVLKGNGDRVIMDVFYKALKWTDKNKNQTPSSNAARWLSPETTYKET